MNTLTSQGLETLNQEELLDVVNEKDQVIGAATYNECHIKGLLRRVAFVFVENDNAELLMQLRGKNVLSPGKWDASVGGHLSRGESYADGAKREMKEEIGIEASLTHITTMRYSRTLPNGWQNEQLNSLYVCRHEGPFTLPTNKI